MRTKWLLTALPLGILGVLLQSSLWVPTYASQSQNPARLLTIVRADLGDPKQLNPTIATDKAAFNVFERNIFEGLMQEDENLKLVPGIAERYETTEEAYLAVLPERKLPDGTLASGRALLALVEAAWKSGKLGGALGSIQALELVPAETRQLTDTVLTRNAKGRDEPVDAELTAEVPERLHITLSKVEPHLFQELEAVVGHAYFEGYPFEGNFKLKKPELLPLVRPHFRELLAIGEHNPVLTFHLRPNVRWHDGQPLTAEDVRFTYQAIMDPKNSSPRTGAFGYVKRVDVIDPLTARVIYKRLYAQGIIDWEIGLIPKHLLDSAGLDREAKEHHLSESERKKLTVRNTSFNRAPIGTGPLRFVEWLPEQYIRLTRNEQYWGQKATMKDAYFRAIPDYLTMELELQAGAIDSYPALPHQAPRYRHDPSYQVHSNNEGAYTYIGYNERLPLFKDARVRRALGMALDTQSIIKYVISGEGKASTGPYYSTTPYYDPSVLPLPYDPKAAAALLEEAGWHKTASGILEKDGKPFEFTLVTNNGNPQRQAIMAIAQEAWLKLGIHCKVQAFEWTVFLEEFVHTLKFDAYVLGWAGGAISPDRFEHFHSSQTHPYETNYVGYQSAEADELLLKIREAYDERELIELTHQFHRLIARDQPYTFVYEPLRPYVFDKRIQRLLRSATGAEETRKLETPPGGDIFQHFTEWRKSGSPALSATD